MHRPLLNASLAIAVEKTIQLLDTQCPAAAAK
jgi:hypothetical protein